MEQQTSSRLPQPSGISRLSRLPIPRNGLQAPILNHKNGIGTAGRKEGDHYEPKNGLRNQEFSAIATNSKESSRDLNERQSGPSLSDRTMETLSQIPPTPSPTRRRSSFFQMEAPLGTPSRPTSSLSRQRPGTSHGNRTGFSASTLGSRPASPEKRRLLPISGNTSPHKAPSGFRPGKATSRNLQRPTSSLHAPPDATPTQQKASGASPNAKQYKTMSASTAQSQTPTGKALKSRPTTRGLFVEPPNARERERDRETPVAKSPANLATTRPEGNFASPKSSAALREAIAKAKAERSRVRKNQKSTATENPPPAGVWSEDKLVTDNRELLQKRIAAARTDGRLNICAMGLSEIPPEIKTMLSVGNWYENVDLVRFLAAGNNIAKLEESLFPTHRLDQDGDSRSDNGSATIFASLETIDLHGNQISKVPKGIGRLERLGSLNLSKNCLSHECFSVIGEIRSLRELRLAENHFESAMDTVLFDLPNLEILDLRNCGISTVSADIHRLGSLATLNLAGNSIETLPLEALASMSLAELVVSHNRLKGTLVPPSVNSLKSITTLDVSHNALEALTSENLSMPHLQFLHVAENRLADLPNLSGFQSLITLSACGNKFKSTPSGLTSLTSLKNVDLSRNDLRKIDEQLGQMDSLTVLTVANNPLRDRKFLTMSTDELKQELRSRIEADADDDECNSTETRSIQNQGWSIHAGGSLERLSPIIDHLPTGDLEALRQVEPIKSCVLRNNLFAQLPVALNVLGETLNALDISGNKLSGVSYIIAELELPRLKCLNVSLNTIKSLQPLLESLHAPSLQELNLSRNRLTELPVLRNSFPRLTSIFAADNKITNLAADTVRGLEVLDVSGNEIEHLEPKLGLLADEGLRTLLVGANRFRVPRRDIVDKGTGAILEWLRGRIPDDDM